MGTAADLLGTRPTGFPLTARGTEPNTGSQKIQVLPASQFEIKVAGAAQRFELGVLDGKMVILRNNPAGGNFVLRTDVPAGGQPKLASERAIKWFSEAVKSPSVETSNFLRASGALKVDPQPVSRSQVSSKASANTSPLFSAFSRAGANGSTSSGLGITFPLTNGKVALDFASANNIGNKVVSTSIGYTRQMTPTTDVLMGVSSVTNQATGAQSNTLSFGGRYNFKLGQVSGFAQGDFLFNPATGALTVRPTASLTYTAPLANGVYFDATIGARIPLLVGGQSPGWQFASNVGIGWKSQDGALSVRAGFGLNFPAGGVDANTARSASGVISVNFRLF
jgi:hypothetical protein